MVGRRNESSKTWFRSDRVFHCNGEWFFHTREGIDVGPYDSNFEAEIEAGLLKELLKTLRDEDAPIATIRDFILDSFSWGRPLSATYSEESNVDSLRAGTSKSGPKKARQRKTEADRTHGERTDEEGNIISLASRRR